MITNKMKLYIFTLSIAMFASCSYVSSKIIRFNDMPKPTGNYNIGTKIYTWTDLSRDEVFTQNPSDKRRIVVQVWYPLDYQTTKQSYYLDNPKKRIRPISDQLGQAGVSPKLISVVISDVKNVKTNSELNAAINTQSSVKYPLIFFSHGLGGMKNQNTIQVEELVSQGYVVIAPDHSYDANITIFDNNDIAPFKSSEYDDTIEYSIEDFYSYRIPQIKTRSADISFIIDQIEILKASKETVWKMIDLDRIGVFGHSFGGGTSLVNAYEDHRIDACIALDGWIKPVPNYIIESGVEKPFLYIGQTTWEDTLNYYKLDKLINNSNFGSKILLPHTKHFDYTDTPYFNNLAKKLNISGDMSTKTIVDTLNHHLVVFFDKYLKDK